MSRLIDADALLEQTQFRFLTNNPIAEIFADCVRIHRENIEEAPTIDAVPVVRCKDCKHWGEEEFAEGGYRECNCQQKDYATTDPKNHAYFQLWLENDFCSYGERKDGGE